MAAVLQHSGLPIPPGLAALPRPPSARPPGPISLRPHALPHLIAVSTAYVAGRRRGPAPEALLSETPFAARVPWRDEVDAARRARSDAEAASRDPKQLARLRAAARSELGAAGVPLLAERTEKLRADWAQDRMVELGKARAQALGWPDAYAYSKALGEWALLEGRGDLPVTVVRPSIIEAALSQPHPGWIRGFRMADPMIISYARGLLKEFPGIPEGIIDVIPVDLVVAAILAVAARGPLAEPGRRPRRLWRPQPAPLPASSSSLVHDWFSEHPLADDKGQPIVVPEWSFPGRRRVQNQLRQATRVLRGAERALQALPLRGSQADLAATIEERRDEAERGPRLRRAVRRLHRDRSHLHRRPPPRALRPALPRRTGRILLRPRRRRLAPLLPRRLLARRRRPRPGPPGQPAPPPPGAERPCPAKNGPAEAVLSPDRQLAVFDLENTLVATNVVDSYAWLATRRMGLPERARFTVRTLLEAPRMFSLDMAR